MVTNEVTSENRIFRTCTPIKIGHVVTPFMRFAKQSYERSDLRNNPMKEVICETNPMKEILFAKLTL